MGAYLTMDLDRKRAVAHMLFYAFQLGDNRPTMRVRLLESPWSTADPVEEVLFQAGWEPRDSGRIDVVGTPIKEAKFDFAAARRQRGASS